MEIWQRFKDDCISGSEGARISKRITDICESWMGTPYMKGQRCKGTGVDCVQFMCGVLDELHNRPLGSTEIDRLSPDTGANDHNGIFGERILLQIMKLNPVEKLGAFCLQPGDILICKLGKGGGGGHAMVVGGNKNILYHACNGERQVTRRGFGSVSHGLHAYRFKNRADW